MGQACDTYGGQESCIDGLGRETDGKGPLGRPRVRWEESIKMDLHEVGCGHGLN
jgi:hypothetical protein